MTSGVMGASHGQLALAEAALMLVCAGAALWALRLEGTGQAAIFATIALSFAGVMLVIDARWRRFSARVSADAASLS